jgi:hypothetical protein
MQIDKIKNMYCGIIINLRVLIFVDFVYNDKIVIVKSGRKLTINVKELREKGTNMAPSLKYIRINVFYYIDDIIHLMQKLVTKKQKKEMAKHLHF